MYMYVCMYLFVQLANMSDSLREKREERPREEEGKKKISTGWKIPSMCVGRNWEKKKNYKVASFSVVHMYVVLSSCVRL